MINDQERIQFLHQELVIMRVPAFKKSENDSVIMDFCGLKCCKHNRFPSYAQTTKKGLKMHLNPFFSQKQNGL